MFCCSSWYIELSSIHMHGCLSGNGPSGICLSYLLSGYTPYFSPDGFHPNPILQNKLTENPHLSLFDQVMHTHNPPIYIYHTSLHNKWWLVFFFFTKSLYRLLQGLVNLVNDTRSHVKYRKKKTVLSYYVHVGSGVPVWGCRGPFIKPCGCALRCPPSSRWWLWGGLRLPADMETWAGKGYTSPCTGEGTAWRGLACK